MCEEDGGDVGVVVGVQRYGFGVRGREVVDFVFEKGGFGLAGPGAELPGDGAGSDALGAVQEVLCRFPDLATDVGSCFGRRARSNLVLGAEGDGVDADEGVVADKVDVVAITEVGGEAVADGDADAVAEA